MSAPVILVTGTDTEVGKTVTTAAITAALMNQGMRVAVVKPAQTGLAPDEPGDADEVARLIGATAVADQSDDVKVTGRGALETYEFVRLPEPLAPDAAARRANVTLPAMAEQAARIVELADRNDIDTVLVEGAGGLLVRLDGDGHTLADLGKTLSSLGLRTGFILVTTARLGTLNATTLTAEALSTRELDLIGYIVGSYPAAPGLAERVNLDELPTAAGTQSLGVIPEGASALPPHEFRELASTWVQL